MDLQFCQVLCVIPQVEFVGQAPQSVYGQGNEILYFCWTQGSYPDMVDFDLSRWVPQQFLLILKNNQANKN